MPRTYDDFVLEFEESESGARTVSVVQSRAGECTVIYSFPFDSAALELRLKDLQIALLRSGGSRRRVLLPEESTVQEFGAALYDSVFTGDVRSLLEASRRKAESSGHGLRIRLRFDSPQLATLPWEFFYDRGIGDFVALATDTPIVRHLSVPASIDALSIQPPLRILGMIASPANLPPIDVRAEQAVVEKSLRKLIEKGVVDLHWVEGQGWRDLRQRMRAEPWHVVHFMGHGAFDTTAREGVVYFADEAGQADAIRAVELNRVLSGNRDLRLVLLNACLGAGGDGKDVFASTAATLIRGGVPAVIAMQFEITDAAATEFARTFYEALVGGLPVDTSVDEARRAISVGIENSLEWGIPVLYMRSADGRIFDVDKSSVPAQPRTATEAPPPKAEPQKPSTTILPLPVPTPDSSKTEPANLPTPNLEPVVEPVTLAAPAQKLAKPTETADATIDPPKASDVSGKRGPRGLSGWRMFFFVTIGTIVIVALIIGWGAWRRGVEQNEWNAAQTATALAIVSPGDALQTLAAQSPTDDQDGDGLSHQREVILGSDPFVADTDEDGIDDGEEAEAGTNPVMQDTDSDGLTDYQERNEAGTDPANPDTDYDGGSDGHEIDIGSDPFKPDTDDDGLLDQEEIVEFQTDPTVPDTDGDGVSDYDEIRIWQTDPLSVNSVVRATPTANVDLPTPTSVARNTPASSVLPTSIRADSALAVGSDARIAEGMNATIRTQPGPGQGQEVGYLSSGDRLKIIGGPVHTEGDLDTIVWWEIETSSLITGWVAANTSWVRLLELDK